MARMQGVEEVSGDLPEVLQKFLAFEQRNLWKPERLRAQGTDAKLDKRYFPESCFAFRIPCFWVRRKHLYVYGEHAGGEGMPKLVDGEGPEARFLFPIHPAELARYLEFLEYVRAESVAEEELRLVATPTSSTRTLLVWREGEGSGAFFAKVSLHSRVLGDRRLSRAKVASSVGLSRLAHQGWGGSPAGINYFPETLGIVPRMMQDAGVLFRAVPKDVNNGRVTLAPLFALMGGSDEQSPLLLTLAKKGPLCLREVLERVLVAQFARVWLDLAFGAGLILEAHAQDLLLTLSPNLAPLGGLYYRDFEGLAVDWALRHAKGLRNPESLPHAFDWFRTYETWGYPRYQLASIKLRTSLFDFLHLVLGELESAILEWQANGMLGGEEVERGELTLLFSRYLRRLIQEKYGMKEGEEYDISHQLNRFVKFLLQVRRVAIGAVA